jgi:DNA-binding NtrC family response regulator
LVIDDDDDVRSTLQVLIREAGCQSLLAADGNEGLRLLRARPVDLVMTDILMPELDGEEIISEIRRHDAAIPIVAMSGMIQAKGVQLLLAAEKLGATRVIGKPFDLDDVISLLRDLLPARPDAERRAS